MTAFFEFLAAFFQYSFTHIESLGNVPNVIFIFVGIVLLVYWMRYVTILSKHEK